jgi:hypothetical protein
VDHNQLNADPALVIANGLKHNKTLQVLQLNSNRITDKGGEKIALALLENRHINFFGLNRNELGPLTGKALIRVLEKNISLSTLQIDKNPDMVLWTEVILFVVRTNKAGRYLLKSDKGRMQCLWPLVLERLDLDMMHYFLKENPGLVPS